ncbi:response regulator transcription factor [Paenibacillus sp. PR3]|uniref:Response regulator transcription factor n=1 Tax=Paenibacillus terricola TaxID=2763503 RepID=A0ABR8N294_9BACL|nr:response regulator transcription factor [Paenibacillus terricola]MBD3922295.1 response regulator transcription factor [Paenibacillus terricola]
MMKVVIVDDEPKVRQGLQTLIPWESLGFTVAATAANGQEALVVIKEEVPEVVIVDIRMPVMDGLQLIQQLTSIGHRMQFIILSGYADFEYAQQAIKYGVTGYLLKPVDTREMSANLIRVRERIEQERAQRSHSQREAVNQELILRNLLVPQETQDAMGDPIKGINQIQEAGLLWNSYEVVVIHPLGSALDRALAKLSDGLKPLIEGRSKGAVAVISPYVVLLLNEPLRGSQRRASLYDEIMNADDGVRFAAATGGAVSAPELVAESYNKAQEAVRLSFFSEKGCLLGPSPHQHSTSESSHVYRDSAEEMEDLVFRLYYCLDVGNDAFILSLLQEAAAYFITQHQDEKAVKESFFFLSNAVIHKLNASARMDSKETEAVSRFLNGIFQQPYLGDLLEAIHRFLLAFAHKSEPGGKEQDFKKMIDFIHKHYADNLKLETLAGLLSYSTAYLGQLFKNRTGEYFNTYLDKVRIQRAKELLSQGMKVYEVAECVGYTNVNYFHSKFKKYEGRSPSEYKNH